MNFFPEPAYADDGRCIGQMMTPLVAELRGDADEFIAHHDLLVAAHRAATAARRIFGQATPIAFEVFRNPEGCEQCSPAQLWMQIGTSLGVDEAMALQQRFDEEYWLDNMRHEARFAGAALEFL